MSSQVRVQVCLCRSREGEGAAATLHNFLAQARIRRIRIRTEISVLLAGSQFKAPHLRPLWKPSISESCRSLPNIMAL